MSAPSQKHGDQSGRQLGFRWDRSDTLELAKGEFFSATGDGTLRYFDYFGYCVYRN